MRTPGTAVIVLLIVAAWCVIVAGTSVKASSVPTLDLCLCCPQHPFRSYEELTSATVQLFTRLVPAETTVRVHWFRNAGDFKLYLRSAHPHVAFLDAALVREATRWGLHPALGAIIDGSVVRRRVVVRSATAIPSAPLATAGLFPAHPGSQQRVSATSDLSALYAVRLGVASGAAVNWVSLEHVNDVDTGLERDFFRATTLLPRERNAVLCLDSARLPRALHARILSELTAPSASLAATLGRMRVDRFCPMDSQGPLLSGQVDPVSTLLVDGGRELRICIPLEAVCHRKAEPLAFKSAVARARFAGSRGGDRRGTVRLLNDGAFEVRVLNPPLPEGHESLTYRVQAGDTLCGIAARLLGDGKLYPTIARANRLGDPDQIEAGRALVINRRGRGNSARVDFEVVFANGSKEGTSFTVRYAR